MISLCGENSKVVVYVFCSLLPTPLNIQIFETQTAISNSLREIIQSRKDMVNKTKKSSYGDDLLGLMLTTTSKENTSQVGKAQFDLQALIDNCRTFFFAGHGASSTFLTWTMMLLASHMNWQELAREEIKQVCGHGDCLLDANMLNKLKIVRCNFFHPVLELLLTHILEHI